MQEREDGQGRRVSGQEEFTRDPRRDPRNTVREKGAGEGLGMGGMGGANSLGMSLTGPRWPKGNDFTSPTTVEATVESAAVHLDVYGYLEVSAVERLVIDVRGNRAACC
eukprot:1184363-Prorocentrum_minimum.AAC.1